MRAKLPVFLILILFLFAAKSHCAEKFSSEATQISVSFSNIAMVEFKSLDPSELSYAEVGSRIQEYGARAATVLLDAGLTSERASSIMEQAASWYGKTLEILFDGGDYNAAIQDYSMKLSDLCSKERISLDTQQRLISLSSLQLQNMNSLFQQLGGNY